MDEPRLARQEQAAAITALVQAAYAPWVPKIGRRPIPIDDDSAARIAAGEAWVLGVDPPLGLLVLEEAGEALLLDNIVVAPAMQGQGLGRRLIDFAEAEARRRGKRTLLLYTHALMAMNIALYARLGFVETGRRREKGFDRVFMAKPLGAQ